MQTHHLCDQVADSKSNQAGVEDHYEALIDVDSHYSRLLIAKNHKNGDLIGLVDDVDVGSGHEGKETDGEHNEEEDVGDFGEDIIDFVEGSFKFGVVPYVVDVVVDTSDLICYLLHFANILHFNFYFSNRYFLVCRNSGELSECIEAYSDLWFEDDMRVK